MSSPMFRRAATDPQGHAWTFVSLVPAYGWDVPSETVECLREPQKVNGPIIVLPLTWRQMLPAELFAHPNVAAVLEPHSLHDDTRATGASPEAP